MIAWSINWFALGGVGCCINLLAWWWLVARKERDIVIKRGRRPWEDDE